MKHIEKYYLIKLATTHYPDNIVDPMKDDSITKFYAVDNVTPSTDSKGRMIQDLHPRQTRFDHYDAEMKGTRDPHAWLATPDLIGKDDHLGPKGYVSNKDQRAAASKNLLAWTQRQKQFLSSLWKGRPRIGSKYRK